MKINGFAYSVHSNKFLVSNKKKNELHKSSRFSWSVMAPETVRRDVVRYHINYDSGFI